MSTLKEMSAEYREAAAKLTLAIKRHEVAGDLSKAEMNRLLHIRSEIREVSYLLSGYYDTPRPESGITLQGLRPRKTRDDH